MEQALKFKFKPLVVKGVAEQMEMPLVLHFTSHLENPIPILTVEQMKKQIINCSPATLPAGSPPITIRVSVNEQGKMTGMGPVGQGSAMAWIGAMRSMESCRYAPYIVNGVATYYKGDIELRAP